MPTRYLLDTNICIYIQRQKPGEVLARFQKLKTGDAGISVITWGELLYGAEKSRQRKKRLCSCWRSSKPLFRFCQFLRMRGKLMGLFVHHWNPKGRLSVTTNCGSPRTLRR
jgi:hypothetical protein